jgi:glycerol-3-phosphate dehydrogenase
VIPLDLVVIGGGITGLGVARLAARSGWSVAVLERGDLASGASSATSHMLHGGLRYLEHGHFALVREALRERAALARMAPDLARPVRFLVPFYRGDRRPPWMVRLGLAAYDAFAGRANLAPHAVVRAREALALEPGLEPEDLTGSGLYSDVVMDDAGLAVAVARDAAAHGATLLTYTEAIGARPAPARHGVPDGAVEVLARDLIEGREVRLVAPLIVNATGAWADATRTTLLRALRPGAPDPPLLMRPTRGIHLVLPRLTRGHAVVRFARSDGRVFFIVPFRDHSLVGTTEVETRSPPDGAAAQPGVDEVRYLRSELERVLPRAAGIPALAVMSGLRPLLAGEGDVGSASREHRIVEDGPLFTLVGGKYTTFRVMARDLVAALTRRLRRGVAPRDADDPLPRPGSATDLETLAGWSVEHGFARRLEDVVRRRSALWLAPDRGRVAASTLAAAMARRLGWSAERTREELGRFHAGLEREERLLQAARARTTRDVA